MVRDVCDHTFSSLDCLWSLRKGVILPRATGQYELMIQRHELDSIALRAVVFEFAPGLIFSVTYSWIAH